MDVVAMYDYYFLTDAHRKFDDKCEFGICENNIVYRRMVSAVDEYKRTVELGNRYAENSSDDGLSDVLEYMLYNVSGDTGLPAHYSCCMYFYNRENGSDDSETDKAPPSGGYVESGHVCNAVPIMIGSRLEGKILRQIAEMIGVPERDFFDADYLHKTYAGSFLVNGTFYYSVFRESNNNKICHNSKSKYRGDETVAYFYDKTCNRGVKLFTDRFGRLRINDRDGVELTDVTSDVMSQLYEECMQDRHHRHYTLDMRLIEGFFAAVKETGLAGIDDFKNKIYTNYSIGLNTFLDKLPSSAMRNPMWNSSLMVGKINFGISQRLSYPKSKSETKKLNEQKLKMCTGGLSTGYLVETQRRRNTRKGGTAGRVESRRAASVTIAGPDVRNKRKNAEDLTMDVRKRTKRDDRGGGGNERATETDCANRAPAPAPSHTILGSKDVKTSGLLEKLEQGERNGPSTFNQVSVSYLPLIRVLSNTVQKLQVEHVHAESSKTVPRDAYGFVCMKYMGNISTAGKNMLFTDRVQVAYGHVHEIVAAVERGIERRAVWKSRRWRADDPTAIPLVLYDDENNNDGCEGWMHVTINNAVTKWIVHGSRLVDFLVFLKTECHRYAWIKVAGRYLCVYYYEGVPLLRYDHGEFMFRFLQSHRTTAADVGPAHNVDSLFFSRHELDMLASMARGFSADVSHSRSQQHRTSNDDLVDAANELIDRWFMRCRADGGLDGADRSSLLAKHLDQYTDYTAPAKRSVSVNARKSACTNVYYQRAAELIRGFSIFVDPDAYERTTAARVKRDHDVPEWVTLRDFARMRAESDNCPQPQHIATTGTDTDRSLANFYLLRTVFADVAGYNVEDANVLDASVDLNLSFNYSFSLTFVDRTKSGLDIIVPPARNAASVCCWDAEGNPTAVLFMVCTIRKKRDYDGGRDRNDGDGDTSGEVEESLRASADARMIGTNSGSSSKRPTGRRQKEKGSAAGDDDSIAFPPFRKLSVIRSEDGNYHVYFIRNDAMLMRKLRAMRASDEDATVTAPRRPNMSNALRLANDDYVFLCKPEVNPYDALDYMRTKVTTFEVNAGERVVTIDARVRGSSDKYDGVKIVNSFGQKGLALIKDLRPYFGRCPATGGNVPVQLVMNNCSFVSRQPIGQYLQMRKNMFAVTRSVAGESTSVGYTAVFFTETEPVTKSCLVRFDEMMRSVIITLGLTTFQNLKSSLDNVYNPRGLLYPPHTRQILSLYRCVGVTYNFAGDKHVPFASRDDVKLLCDIYDAYSRTPKPTKATNASNVKALLDVLDAMIDENKTRRLIDVGVLTKRSSDVEDDRCDGGGGGSGDNNGTTRVVRLLGQWIEGFGGGSGRARRYEASRRRNVPDFVLRTYDSTSRKHETIHVYGEPCLLADALDENYAASIDRLAYRTAETIDTDEESLATRIV